MGNKTPPASSINQRTVLEGKWLRAMTIYRDVQSGPQHAWGPAATRVARTRARNLSFSSMWERRCSILHRRMGELARAAAENPATHFY